MDCARVRDSWQMGNEQGFSGDVSLARYKAAEELKKDVIFRRILYQ